VDPPLFAPVPRGMPRGMVATAGVPPPNHLLQACAGLTRSPPVRTVS
jgi:hypothetical protein